MKGREARHTEGEDQEHPQAGPARPLVPIEDLERHPVLHVVLVVVDHVVEDVHHEEVEAKPGVLELHLRRDQKLIQQLGWDGHRHDVDPVKRANSISERSRKTERGRWGAVDLATMNRR